MKTRRRAEIRRSKREREEEQRRAKEEDRQWEIPTPNDPQNEQVVLAAMLVDGESADRLLLVCPSDAFYDEDHKRIRSAIAKARRQKLALDPATLYRLDPEVDIRIIEQLQQGRPEVTENIDHHVDLLLWDRTRAAIARGPLTTLYEGIQDATASRDRLRAVASQLADAFAVASERSRFLRVPKDVVSRMMDDIKARAGGRVFRYARERDAGIGVGALDIDSEGKRIILQGPSLGTITLVSSLSGSGKSLTMCHLALAAARQKRPVLYGSWEEEAPIDLETMTTISLGWSRTNMLWGMSSKSDEDDALTPLTKEEQIVFEERAHEILKRVTFFDNPWDHRDRTPTGRDVTNDDHLDAIHSHIAMSGCEVAFFDLLHRCLVDDAPSDEKRFLYRFLSMVQGEKIHAIAAHQQRAKDIETRARKEPTREGIIGAGAWLDIPWTIIAPHIPSKWKAVVENIIQWFILKQRKGPWPIGVELEYEPSTGQLGKGVFFDPKLLTAGDSSDGVGFGKPMSTKRPVSNPRKPRRFGENRAS